MSSAAEVVVIGAGQSGLAAVRQVEPRSRIRERAVEQLMLTIPKLFPERVAPGRSRRSGQRLDQPLWLPDRQRPQHQRVHQ